MADEESTSKLLGFSGHNWFAGPAHSLHEDLDVARKYFASILGMRGINNDDLLAIEGMLKQLHEYLIQLKEPKHKNNLPEEIQKLKQEIETKVGKFASSIRGQESVVYEKGKKTLLESAARDIEQHLNYLLQEVNKDLHTESKSKSRPGI